MGRVDADMSSPDGTSRKDFSAVDAGERPPDCQNLHRLAQLQRDCHGYAKPTDSSLWEVELGSRRQSKRETEMKVVLI